MTEFPKPTANKLITALTYIIPGLLVFEIIYRLGYFMGMPESFSFVALLIHLLWSVALSLPFHFMSWLFLRSVRGAKAKDLPGIKAMFVAILVGVFYMFEELMSHGYLNFRMRYEVIYEYSDFITRPVDVYKKGYLALTLLFTAVIAFPLGILYARLVGWVISRQERSIGEER